MNIASTQEGEEVRILAMLASTQPLPSVRTIRTHAHAAALSTLPKVGEK